MKRALSSATVEKDVEAAYKTAITKGRKHAVLHSPLNTDGYAVWDVKVAEPPATVRLLLEAKYDLDLK